MVQFSKNCAHLIQPYLRQIIDIVGVLTDSQTDPASLPQHTHILSTYSTQILIDDLFPKHFKSAHINTESLRGHIDVIRAIVLPQTFDVIAVS